MGLENVRELLYFLYGDPSTRNGRYFPFYFHSLTGEGHGHQTPQIKYRKVGQKTP